MTSALEHSVGLAVVLVQTTSQHNKRRLLRVDELDNISTNGSSEHRGKRDRAHDLVSFLHRVHRNDRTSSLGASAGNSTPPTILFRKIEDLF